MEGLWSHWNPSWDEMPWQPLSSPAERFQVGKARGKNYKKGLLNVVYLFVVTLSVQHLPSFVLGEIMVITSALLLLFHAAKQVKGTEEKNFDNTHWHLIATGKSPRRHLGAQPRDRISQRCFLHGAANR